jgi:hypothetical protein
LLWSDHFFFVFPAGVPAIGPLEAPPVPSASP